MKVLFLSEWYPHRHDAMAGLFVRKHARAAVCQGADVTVLYLHLDPHITEEELIEQVTDGVKEVYVYYPSKWGYLRACRHGYQYIKHSWGRPDLCQLNVISKNGLLPLFLRKVLNIPYIIVEHWSGYLPINRQQNLDWLHLLWARLLARNAQVVLPVSQTLMNAMKDCGIECRHWQQIHNVVDDFFYLPILTSTRQEKPHPINFIHISCFDEHAKNIQGLLRVVKQLADEQLTFHLTLVGSGVDFNKDKNYAESLGLIPQWVSFTGELHPQQVAQQLREANAMLLFSNYENAPVVISEALAMGIPILSTNAGGIPEMVDTSCGVLVKIGDEKNMAQTMKQFIKGDLYFNKKSISEYGKQYSITEVGNNLIQLYTNVIREMHPNE